MLGAAPLAEKDGVILFSGLATNPDIAEAGDYIFRTSISDAQLGVDTGNVLWADGIRKLVTITEATDYAEGVRRTSVAQFEKRGGQVAAAERYASDVTDFRTQLTKLFGENPDALHIAAQSRVRRPGTIIKQARELGYDGPIYSEIVAVGKTALDIAGDAAAGVKAIVQDISPGQREGAGRFSASSGSATARSRWPGTLGRRTTMSTSPPSASRRPGTTRTPTDSGTVSTELRGPARLGENYSFDEKGEVVGLTNVVVQVLPLAERTADNQGYKVLGSAPSE